MDCSSSQPVEPSGRLPRPTFSAEQEAAIFRAAGQRVTAAVRGQRAESCRRLLGQTADTPVYGAFVSLKRAGRLRSCCGHIESTVPLWRGLDSAADRAATDDPRFPRIVTAELDQLDMDVWILWGPEPVLARGEDRVQAITIGKHGVQIGRGRPADCCCPAWRWIMGWMRGGCWNRSASRLACPPRPGKTTTRNCGFSRGMSFMAGWVPEETDARQPAVAGGFYPGDARGVARMVDQLFAASAVPAAQSWAGAPWCLMPAGSIRAVWRRPCSAAWRFRRGQSFCVPGIGRWAPEWAVAPHRRWLFPGGELASDPELAARLAHAVDGLVLDAAAHREEHAIEVQLPLLAHVAPQSGWWGLSWATARCRNCCGSATSWPRR